jgi:hypothetical protein
MKFGVEEFVDTSQVWLNLDKVDRHVLRRPT